ncbi:MAG: hypothetical protein ACYS9C_04115 [Planctomycetota bacterium]|jgi:hypothetical protein
MENCNHTLSIQFKPDFDTCLARIYAWYEQRIIDRPPVRFHHHNLEYEKHRIVKGPWKTHEERWLDVDFQVQTFINSLDTTEFLGETFPVYWPNLSALAYNLFLGQPAVFDDVTAWTHPCIDDLENLSALKVQWDSKYFKAVEAMTQRALERAEGKFMVGYTDMYAGIDCTAMLRSVEKLCLDLILQPQPLKHLIDLVFEEYPQVYNHFDRTLKEHSQLSVTWMNLPSFETFNVLACDFATNISPAHFEEYCMPIIRKEAKLFKHNVFHMDGPGVARHIDAILTLLNLQAVQWVQGYGINEPIMQWIPLIKKIQEAGKSVIVDLKMHELDEFIKKVDPAGVMLWVLAEPREQKDVLGRVARW